MSSDQKRIMMCIHLFKKKMERREGREGGREGEKKEGKTEGMKEIQKTCKQIWADEDSERARNGTGPQQRGSVAEPLKF